MHRVLLQNLEYDTTYYYQVGSAKCVISLATVYQVLFTRSAHINSCQHVLSVLHRAGIKSRLIISFCHVDDIFVPVFVKLIGNYRWFLYKSFTCSMHNHKYVYDFNIYYNPTFDMLYAFSLATISMAGRKCTSLLPSMNQVHRCMRYISNANYDRNSCIVFSSLETCICYRLRTIRWPSF